MKALIFFLYRLLQWIALPAVVLYLSVRALRHPGYGLRERLGGAPTGLVGLRTQPGGVWLHAVSVGEVLSAVRLIRELRAALPDRPIVVSVGTVAGRKLADAKLKGIADQIFYAPLDYAWCVRQVLRRIRPSLVLILETEIWPNLWNEATKTGAALMVVNGRLSDRAWPRYQALRWFFSPVMKLPAAILTQDATSRQRYLALGAHPDRVSLAGNLKYDLASPAAPAAEIAKAIHSMNPQHVWIAASTMPPAVADDPDEDEVVIQAFQKLAPQCPNLLLILVPRKPERFDSAAGKLQVAGIRFVRRTRLDSRDNPALPGLPAVLLLDSVGELGSLFPLANVTFMGGTLASRGGHNILEPAFAANPVIVGPHMENFAEIARAFRESNALVEIRCSEELAPAVRRILLDGDDGVGTRAQIAAKSGQGATARAVKTAAEVLARVNPVVSASLPLRVAASLWSTGARVHRQHYNDPARQMVLPKPVISVGGIAVGGSGKTPLAIWLGRQLAETGVRPAFLTRGYKRALNSVVVVQPGGIADTAFTGDEAQILMRSAVGPVGIGEDRSAAAQHMLASHEPPDVFILDDGFQHHRLHHDFDLVAIDALDPFAGGRTLPAGRLRELPESLRHASAIVITRTSATANYEFLHQQIQRWNPTAPLFHARNSSRGWHDLQGLKAAIAGPAVAFCGLGNPNSFWRSVQEDGIDVRERVEFADHHPYSDEDLIRLRGSAERVGGCCLLTTEKDVMNLPRDAATILGTVRVLWLKIEIEVDDGARLLDLICRTIS